MELASNLIWACVTVLLLCAALRSTRHRTRGISTGSAVLLTLLICMLLLPVVSLTDDILLSQQAAIPSQTWRLASESSSVGVEIVPLLSVLLLFLDHRAAEVQRLDTSVWQLRPQAVWLTRSLRLRPPPASVLL